MELESERTGETLKPSDSPGSAGELSAAGLQAARMALLNPRQQLRSAVALQVGQLNELATVLRTFQDLMERTGAEWSGWIDQSHGILEAGNRSLEELSLAKRQQEESFLTLRQGLIAAKDEDTARLEAGLRNLASATQELRNATETVAGTGKRFQAQVHEMLQELERRLPEAAAMAGRQLEQPIQQFLKGVRPLTWIGGTLGMLVAADLLVRALK